MRNVVRLGLIVPLLAACTADDLPTGSLSSAGVLRSAMTEQAARSLDSRGHIRLPAVAREGQISGTDARDQAGAWLQTFAKYHVSRFSAERGAPVDVSTLQVCGDPLYATSAYADIPVGGWGSPAARRAFGPQWLVSFCDPQGARVLFLAVSALNTDVGVEDGQLRLPRLQGSQFRSYAIPRDLSELPLSPERAVDLAFRATGVRVSAVPELHLPPRPQPAFEARWKVTLERAVEFVTDAQERVMTNEVWIGNPTRRSMPNLAVGREPVAAVDITFKPMRSDGKGFDAERTVTVVARAERAIWRSARPAGGR